jgi:large subunit ribosomal protein L9
MQNQLLLLEDVDNLGRSGDVVSTKPGYARNYLFPQKKAIVADKITLRLQKRLQEERAKRAVVDKAEALQIAERLAQITLTIQVKVDPEGKLYGSVSAADIMNLCAQEGIVLERKQLLLPHPIKALGNHTISLRLKEAAHEPASE